MESLSFTPMSDLEWRTCNARYVNLDILTGLTFIGYLALIKTSFEKPCLS